MLFKAPTKDDSSQRLNARGRVANVPKVYSGGPMYQGIFKGCCVSSRVYEASTVLISFSVLNTYNGGRLQQNLEYRPTGRTPPSPISPPLHA